jgi:hypothetical protein
VILLEPTCSALGLAEADHCERAVAAGAWDLLEAASDAREAVLKQAHLDSSDQLVVGVVEAVEECVLSPPRDCIDLRARAELEAARWVDDFLADDVRNDKSLAAQQAMFLLAQLVADAVADALIERISTQRVVPQARPVLDVTVDELGRLINVAFASVLRIGGVIRRVSQLATPSRLPIAAHRGAIVNLGNLLWTSIGRQRPLHQHKMNLEDASCPGNQETQKTKPGGGG